mmetsp:Transcript_5597/g.12210  ORF Transcript_5597/g.12210 Transcript_5597/m.12210 type:complete len:224 (-) Transcript_5597:64-735(-)
MLNGPFRDDLELIFDNAVLFNPPDDWIAVAAVALKKSVTKKIDAAAYAAEKKNASGDGNRNQRKSMYVDEDSDVYIYEYESDKDDDFGTGFECAGSGLRVVVVGFGLVSFAPVGGSCSRGVVFGSGFGVCFSFDGIRAVGFDCNGPVAGFSVCFGFAPVAGSGVGFDGSGLRIGSGVDGSGLRGVTVAAGRLDLRDVCTVHSVSLPVLMGMSVCFYCLELLKS